MKSKKEIEFDKLCDEYKEKFGVPFPVMITARFDIDEKIAELKNCLDQKKMAEEFKYVEGNEY